MQEEIIFSSREWLGLYRALMRWRPREFGEWRRMSRLADALELTEAERDDLRWQVAPQPDGGERITMRLDGQIARALTSMQRRDAVKLMQEQIPLFALSERATVREVLVKLGWEDPDA